MAIAENDQVATDILKNYLKGLAYDKGELDRRKADYVTPAIALNKLKCYPGMVDTDVILFFLIDESRKVKKRYDGSIPDDDVDKLAGEFHEALKQLPSTYKFYFEMPNELKIKRELKIDKGIRFVRITEDAVDKISRTNQFTYLRHKGRLASVFKQLSNQPSTTPAEPHYTNLESGKVYLEIDAKGFSGGSYAITLDVDPIHVFKLLIAYLELNKVLLHSSLFHIVGRNPYQRANKDVIIYKSNMEFVTDLARPSDEANYTSRLDFSKELRVSNVKNLVRVFKKLLVPMSNEYLEEERNKIVNSLFWYFEGQKSETPAFKTLMCTAMFDSFFGTVESKEAKARSIVSLIGTDPNDDMIYNKLVTLYGRRNNIAHGKIQLMEVDHKTKKQRDTNLESEIRNIYQSYILVKIKKLLS